MKLELLTSDVYDGELVEEFKDMYLNPELIIGWYLPNQGIEKYTTVTYFIIQIFLQ